MMCPLVALVIFVWHAHIIPGIPENAVFYSFVVSSSWKDLRKNSPLMSLWAPSPTQTWSPTSGERIGMKVATYEK